MSGSVTGKNTIIILDDDVVLREHFAVVLEGQGFQVVGADDSDSIMELIKEYSPSLIITDLFMPEHNGAEAIINIREHSNIPVIVITGYENMLNIVKPMVNASLLKPVTDAQLLDTVKDVLKEPLSS